MITRPALPHTSDGPPAPPSRGRTRSASPKTHGRAGAGQDSTALAWPHRPPPAVTAPVDWTRAHAWTFEPVDATRFPEIEPAREAGRLGGTAPAVFSAANEEAVTAFLTGTALFTAITRAIERALTDHAPDHDPSGELTLHAVREADAWARRRTRHHLHRLVSPAKGA
ncbi:hypothetical protein [Streptomyces klenkii]